MRNICWVMMIACLLVRQAAARDIHVDNVGGDDKNDGMYAQSQGDTPSPLRTIAKALRLAVHGRPHPADQLRPAVPRVRVAGRERGTAARRG